MSEFELFVEFLDVQEWQKGDSCNGCHERPIVRIVEIGTRGPGMSSGSSFRLCQECFNVLKTKVALA